MEDNNKIISSKHFAAFVTDSNNYWIYLVNPTDKRYEKVVTLTGGQLSDDQGVLETGKSMKDWGALAPKSFIQIESSDLWGWGDGLVWFEVDLYSDNKTTPEMFVFMPDKYYSLQHKVMLPVLNKIGIFNELAPRKEQTSIEEKIKKMNMGSVYHKFTD
jgi:hypothetical protein